MLAVGPQVSELATRDEDILKMFSECLAAHEGDVLLGSSGIFLRIFYKNGNVPGETSSTNVFRRCSPKAGDEEWKGGTPSVECLSISRH